MKKRHILALACALSLAAGGCARTDGTDAAGEQASYKVYYSALEDQQAQAAVDCEAHAFRTGAAVVPDLMQALLSQPDTPGLASPFPEGVRLLSWTLEEGALHLDLSEQFGGLSGVNLTVADACLALTFCQVEGVESVYVTVEGGEIPYRPIQHLTEQDIALDGGAAGTGYASLGR